MSDEQKPPRAKNQWLAQLPQIQALRAKMEAEGTWATLSDGPLPPGSAVITIPFPTGSPPPKNTVSSAPNAPVPSASEKNPRDMTPAEYERFLNQRVAEIKAEERAINPRGFLD